MTVAIGGGDVYNTEALPMRPDSTFVTELTALDAAGTAIPGKLVTLTFAANWGCTSGADGAIPDGMVTNYERDPIYTWILTVNLWTYIDQNSVRHPATRILHVHTDGTMALQDSMIIDGSDYMSVDDGGTGGWGGCICHDEPTDYSDFLV